MTVREQQLEQALRFYADPANWLTGAANHETGERARTALDATPAAPSGEYARAIEEVPALREELREAREQRDEANQMIAMLCDEKIKPLQARVHELEHEARDDARLTLASALDRALTCWRDPEMRASAHFDAAMDDLARLSPGAKTPARENET